ncbi:hypothetical protein [Candidatus Thiodictyon syntrophicum]|nr:hypothetical protein [Candidatus Thiodictyon syntrophicum]
MMLSSRLSRASLLVAGLMLCASAWQAQAFETVIQVSPSALNIGSAGNVVTVHTEVPYGDVEVHSVYLNGVLIASSKADDRGNFVAKFDIDAIKTLNGLIIGGDNKLTLTGLTTYGEAFSGTDWVRVINILPRSR